MLPHASHLLNWYAGWSLILVGFVDGAVLGMFFHRDEFLGGYSSFRRRIVRLGHIALVALGIINVLFAISVPTGRPLVRCAGIAFVIGGLAMPIVCFLTGWKSGFRHF